MTQKELIIKSKKEFLLENGIMENLDTNIINNKINNIHSMNNFDDIKTFKKKNIGIKNSLKKSKNINITKSNSKFIDYLNINNSNINITTNNNNINSTNTNLLTTNINQESQPSNKNIKKRIILKPKINQFEYINKIAQEQKKLITQNKHDKEKRSKSKKKTKKQKTNRYKKRNKSYEKESDNEEDKKDKNEYDFMQPLNAKIRTKEGSVKSVLDNDKKDKKENYSDDYDDSEKSEEKRKPYVTPHLLPND